MKEQVLFKDEHYEGRLDYVYEFAHVGCDLTVNKKLKASMISKIYLYIRI